MNRLKEACIRLTSDRKKYVCQILDRLQNVEKFHLMYDKFYAGIRRKLGKIKFPHLTDLMIRGPDAEKILPTMAGDI